MTGAGLSDPEMHIAQPADQPGWTARFASVFSLANGRVGVEGSLDECASTPDCYLPDAYVTRPIHYHEAFAGFARSTDTRVKCPSPVFVALRIDGEDIDFGQAEITAFSRHLDLGAGLLHRETIWRLTDGREIAFRVDRLVPLNAAALVASRVSISPVNFAADIVAMPGFGAVDPDEPSNDAGEEDPRIAARLIGKWTKSAGGTTSTTRFSNGQVHLAYRQTLSSRAGAVGDKDGLQTVSARVAQGGSLSFDRIVEITCGRHAEPDLPPAATMTFDALASAQKAALGAFWSNALCTIGGDPDLTRALRFNLFQLAQSASRNGRHSIAAKGLSGEGYEGHYFWDAEAFMLPALVYLDPARARNVLEFRIRTLDRARDIARAMGHRTGALYPWRTIAGDECSAHYPTGSAQYHINGDIAWGLKLYCAATGDRQILRDAGAEMLFETARVWMQVGTFDTRRGGAFCIHSVTGPDEYSALVDNDYFTNAVAKRHLAFAAEVAAQLRETDSKAFAELASRIALGTDEIALWQRASDRMWITVDAEDNVSPQDDAFLGKPDYDLGPIRLRGHPLLLNHHPLTLFRHKICKQGDVIQATAMDLVSLPLSLKERNYRFYEPITTHDSTLSSVSFAMAAADIGAFDAALAFHKEAAFVDLEDRHGNTFHGLHLAALAGSWLVLAQGWGGLRVVEGQLAFRPVIHPDCPHYSFRLGWRGSNIEVKVDQTGATYTLISGPDIALFDHGRTVTAGSTPTTLPRPVLKGIIFDLDGVLTDTAEDHYRAWQALAHEHGLIFDRATNEQLKGVDRRNSLTIILKKSSRIVTQDQFDAMMAEKNAIYRAGLAHYTPANLFDGIHVLFAKCRTAGLKIGLASASQNARDVVARLGIAGDFDFIADASSVADQKPAPDIFLACAAGMGLAPETCAGVEDASAGIDAIHAAGMVAIGIGTAAALPLADLHVASTGTLTIDQIFAADAQFSARPTSKTR